MRNGDGRAVTYEPGFYDDLVRWRDNDPRTGARVVELIESAIEHPKKAGRGRPKRYGGLPGVWSMRISRAHRLFYVVHEGKLRFLSCRGRDLHPELVCELREGRFAGANDG